MTFLSLGEREDRLSLGEEEAGAARLRREADTRVALAPVRDESEGELTAGLTDAPPTFVRRLG